MRHVWSMDERDHVAELLKSGLSMGTIAKQLGLTRNMVVGRVYRDGSLHGFAARVALKPARTRERKPVLILAKVMPPKPVPKPPDTSAARPLIELTAGQCKWPVVQDDNVVGRHLFCALAVVELTRPYCAYHARRSRTTD